MSNNSIKKAEDNTAVFIDPDELSVAEKASEQSNVSFTLTFKRPFTYQDKTYSALTFDWEKLTGDDGLAIENEMLQIGKAVVVPTFSGEYLIRMAARACRERIGSDAFGKMSLSEYNKIRSEARSFLLKSE